MSETYYIIKRSTLDRLAHGFRGATGETETLTLADMVDWLGHVDYCPGEDNGTEDFVPEAGEAYYKISHSTLVSLADGFRGATGEAGELTLSEMIALLAYMRAKLYEDVPKDDDNGVRNTLARAALWQNIEYTAQGTMYADDEDDAVVNAGDKVRGLWYSSTRGTDDFIGYAVSLYSLMTAINNPRSVLYKRRYSSYFANDKALNGAENTYGSNCSQYVSWSLGLPYLTVTNWLPKLECFVNENGVHDTTYGGLCWDAEAGEVDTEALRTGLKLCDVADCHANFGGGEAHTVMVTGIRRDKRGVIQEVDISEDWWASPKTEDGRKTFGCLKTTTYAWDDFVAKYVTQYKYRFYRYNALASVPESPEDELKSIVYSNLCTNRGDKVAIRPDQDLCLNVVDNANSYTGIVLLKNGTYHSHHEGTDDWWLIHPDADININVLGDSPTGKYTAILYGDGVDPTTLTEADATDTNSTRFIVCAVTVTRDTSTVPHTYAYTAEEVGGVYPTPMQVTIKDTLGYTVEVHQIDGTGFAGSGSKKISYYGGNYDYFMHVPFKTEYGFVIAENKFDNNPLTKPDLPETADDVNGGTDEPEVTTYTVTFSVYGFDAPAEQKVAEGGTVTEPTMTDTAQYIFGGWYTAEDLETAYDFTTPVTADVTLYGKVYSIVEYIEFVKGTDKKSVYFDTGLDAADLDETSLDYTWEGVVNGVASDGVTHLWGARDNDGSSTNIYSGCCNINRITGTDDYLLSMHLGTTWQQATNTAMTGLVATDKRIKVVANEVSMKTPTAASLTLYSEYSGGKYGKEAAITLPTYTAGTFTNSHNIYWMATNKYGTAQGTFEGRHYGGQIRKTGGATLRDYKPVMISPTKEIGLLDLVNKKFCPKQGSGTITAGPEVSET